MKDSKPFDLKQFDFEKIKNIFKNKNLLFILGIAGILLIFLSDFIAKPKPIEKQPVEASSSAEYAQRLEERLEKILVNVSGAGAVQVMVTLESSEKQVYAQAEKSNTDYSLSNDDRTSEKSTYQSDYIIVDDSDGGKTALTQTTLEPEVKGVAVICQGADNLTVQSDITEMVSVVLGIPSNRVCVIKMT